MGLLDPTLIEGMVIPEEVSRDIDLRGAVA